MDYQAIVNIFKKNEGKNFTIYTDIEVHTASMYGNDFKEYRKEFENNSFREKTTIVFFGVTYLELKSEVTKYGTTTKKIVYLPYEH